MSDRTQSTTGPDGNWTVIVEENWEQFDSDWWGVGFIDRDEWIPDDDATVSPDHVFVEGEQCVLEVESEGTGPSGCYQGVINSSVGGEPHHPSIGIPIDLSPGQYVEARLKLPGRTGVLPAFWMHPANTKWPPEIDIVELFQRGADPETERRLMNVDVHWSASGEPNDRGTHEHAPSSVDTGIDLTESFNRYGCAWFEDRIEWYFNGQQIATRSSLPTMIGSLTASTAQPFGLIFSNHVNRIGQADLTRAWTEQLVIDWITISELSS
ncbi:glycosyl hydrolase family 16 [Halohasta litchfieldiae]|jgi:hypothetical protein|uniref:Glycosyl hydrolases family 16 n=1 Tax=Halohasta litchfieldiae TaxID=1073996 RepID=A0A1H6W149_9EURY|nr:family 16 glycosylhydrolase [Halohasta litchfieldiae]ATW88142.1 glycosyl hydrolase family 16 [Halohasta litchfieldiae]SEJ10668.1 Glycosyl hydrolases family 16 [Halohasta litchfieldiae]